MDTAGRPLATRRLARIGLFAASVLLIYPGLASNWWGVADQDEFGIFQRDSESLVVGRLAQARQGGLFSYGGLMGQGVSTANLPHGVIESQYVAYNDGLVFTLFEPYQSQPGAQGILFAGLDTVLGGSASERLQRYHDLTALLTALALSLVVLWFFLEFGFPVAVVVLLSILASQWLVLFGRNLYWSLWSYYAPFLATLYWLRRADAPSAHAPARFGGVVFLAVAAMCLFTGYAYITTTVIMAAVPLIFYAVRDRWRPRRTASMLIAGTLGSAAAMAITAALLIVQIASVQGNLQAGVEHLLFSFAKRTYADSANLPAVYAPSLRAPVVEVVAEYLRGRFFDLNRFVVSSNDFVVRYVFKVRYVYLIALFLAASAAVWLAGGRRFGETPSASRRALLVATWFSLLAPLSWFIIFKAHSSIHTHINYIVWQMPFTLFGFAVVGLVAGDVLAFLRRRALPPVVSH